MANPAAKTPESFRSGLNVRFCPLHAGLPIEVLARLHVTEAVLNEHDILVFDKVQMT